MPMPGFEAFRRGGEPAKKVEPERRPQAADERQDLISEAIWTIGRFTGREYKELFEAVSKMDVPALKSMLMFFGDVERDIERERHAGGGGSQYRYPPREPGFRSARSFRR